MSLSHDTLKALHEAATPGPWLRIDTPDYAEIHSQFRPSSQAIALVGKPDDTDLIAYLRNAVPEILPLIAERDAMRGGWQPIETAPKDGTRVDLGQSYLSKGKPHFRRVPDCYWHKKGRKWVSKWHDRDGYSALRLPFEPTHWMPLPSVAALGGNHHER